LPEKQSVYSLFLIPLTLALTARFSLKDSFLWIKNAKNLRLFSEYTYITDVASQSNAHFTPSHFLILSHASLGKFKFPMSYISAKESKFYFSYFKENFKPLPVIFYYWEVDFPNKSTKTRFYKLKTLDETDKHKLLFNQNDEKQKKTTDYQSNNLIYTSKENESFKLAGNENDYKIISTDSKDIDSYSEILYSKTIKYLLFFLFGLLGLTGIMTFLFWLEATIWQLGGAFLLFGGLLVTLGLELYTCFKRFKNCKIAKLVYMDIHLNNDKNKLLLLNPNLPGGVNYLNNPTLFFNGNDLASQTGPLKILVSNSENIPVRIYLWLSEKKSNKAFIIGIHQIKIMN
jgi:hypothetical protein